MRSMIKFFMIVIGLVLIAMAVGLWLIRDRLEMRLLERISANLEQQLGTPVTVDAISFASGGRAIALDGMTLHSLESNQDGEDIIVRFDKILVYPGYGTLMSNQRKVKRMVFVHPEIYLRHTGGMNTNLNDIGKHLYSRARQPTDIKSSRPVYLVDTVEIFPAKVTVTTTSLPIPAVPFTTAKYRLDELTSNPQDLPDVLLKLYTAMTQSIWNLPGLSRFQDRTYIETNESE